jgi:hypothetical protein
MSTTAIGFEPRQYVPPARVRVNRNIRATSQNTEEATVRLGPQMHPEDLKKYTKPEMGRLVTMSTMEKGSHNDCSQLPLNPNIPTKNHKKIGLPEK